MAMDLAGFIRVAIVLSVVVLVLGLGLRSAAGDVTYLLRKPGLLARSLLAMNVLLPLLVFGLIELFVLRPAVEVALLALAISPVPPVLPGRQLKISANPAYVHALFMTTSLLAIVFVPAALALIAQRMGGVLHVNVAQVFGIVTVTALMPLSLGMIVRRLYPRMAPLLYPWMERLGTALLLVTLVIVIVVEWSAMRSLIGDGSLLAIVTFTGIGLVLGHLLGGPEPGNRSVLALATAARHPGVALAIATASFPNQRLVPAAILLAALVGMLARVPYTAWRKRALQASGPRCHGK